MIKIKLRETERNLFSKDEQQKKRRITHDNMIQTFDTKSFFHSIFRNHFISFRLNESFENRDTIWKFLLLSFRNCVNRRMELKKKSIYRLRFQILHCKISHLVVFVYVVAHFHKLWMKLFFLLVWIFFSSVFFASDFAICCWNVISLNIFHGFSLQCATNKTHSFWSHFRFSPNTKQQPDCCFAPNSKQMWFHGQFCECR